jgi:hypothetical protein
MPDEAVNNSDALQGPSGSRGDRMTHAEAEAE